MTGPIVPILAALIVQFALGLIVFQANRHRLANQCFLLLSLVIDGWLVSLYLAFISKNPAAAEFAIRQASASGAIYLATLNLLRLSIRQKQQNWRDIFRNSRVWLALTFAVVVWCQTKLFLKGAVMPQELGGAPAPIYRQWADYLYGAYFAVGLVVLIISYWRDFKQTTGGERAELAFVLIGAVSGVALALLLALVLEHYLGPAHAIWFAPLRVVFISLVIAYGIATRKIMDVGLLVRRIISYVLLTGYLLALYAGVWWLVAGALQSGAARNAHSVAHVAAAIVIAFAMAPARGISQRLADRLFVGARRLDLQATLKQAAAILQSVTTLRELLQRFADTIGGAVDTDRVLILLPDKHGFSQQYPRADAGSRYRLEMARDQATIVQLEAEREPIVVEELRRVRPTTQLQRVMRQLDSLQIALAMGIFARDQLAGVMLLGPRKTGRIYGSVEQNALQVLCGQLAVAIENAEL
ncbi:MAG TPA: GAF domain-containing protein, partial [Chthoniobacterales bacterium]